MTFTKAIQIKMILMPLVDDESIVRQVKGFIKDLENDNVVKKSEFNYRVMVSECQIVE